MEKSKKKFALVLTGGGMRSAHGAGVLFGLGKELSFIKPDILIAGSGSAGGAMAYLANRFDAIKEIWTDILPEEKKLISFFRRPVIDIDYLIDEVLKKIVQADAAVLEDIRTRFYLPVRNASTGELSYLDNDDDFDVFEELRATKAVPIVYGKKITLGSSKYIDGYFGLGPNTLIQKAIEEGATKILLVNDDPSWSRSFLFNNILETIFLPATVAKGIRSDREKEQNYVLPDNITFMEISFPLKNISTLNNRAKTLRKAFSQGYQTMFPGTQVWNFLHQRLFDVFYTDTANYISNKGSERI